MSGIENPLHAACYADFAIQAHAPVLENVALAQGTYRIRCHCPELARRIFPGQFVMMRLPACDDPLLGRPLALYDTVLDDSSEPIGIDIVYLVVGKMTARLATYTLGDEIELWGPLGNGFVPAPTSHLIMVAGGIGQTPFLAVGREMLCGRIYGTPSRNVTPTDRVTLCYGARTANLLAGVSDFQQAGIDVRTSTDDGTAGFHGLVTDLLREELTSSDVEDCRVVCCGPEPMMEAVADICIDARVPCQVSLESPMACGIGICFSCVTKVRQGNGAWDYKRTCVDGPVFDAKQIEW